MKKIILCLAMGVSLPFGLRAMTASTTTSGASVIEERVARLKNCIREGDIARLTEYLDKGAAAHGFIEMLLDSEGNTLIHLAVLEQADERVLQLIKERGADLNKKNVLGDTPLHCATKRGDTRRMAQLIRWGVSVNLRNNLGKTPLYCACETNKMEVVDQLLVPQLNPNIMAYNGFTPLIVASAVGNQDIVELLLSNKAQSSHKIDVSCETNEGQTALFFAALEQSFKVVQLLIDAGADIRKTSCSDASTVLHIVASTGNLPLVRLLVDHGALLNAQSNDGTTPAFNAAEKGHAEVVDYFISRRADFSLARKADGCTPLHIACLYHYESVVTRIAAFNKDLLTLRADVPYHAMKQLTPLHVATFQPVNERIVELLIKHGAPIDAVDGYEHTPLQFLIAYSNSMLSDPIYDAYESARHEKIIRLLINGGANLNAKAGGRTPLELAQDSHNHRLETIIQEALIKASPCHYCKKLALPKKCAGCSNVQYCSKNCQALDWATHKQSCKKESVASSQSSSSSSTQPSSLETLDPVLRELTGSERETFMNAFNNGKVEVRTVYENGQRRVLVRPYRGSEPAGSSGSSSSTSRSSSVQKSLPNDEDASKALIAACKENNIKRVEELLKAGTLNVNCADEGGNTPLHVASFLGFEKIAELLLKYKPLNADYAVKSGLRNNHDAAAIHMAYNKAHLTLLGLLRADINLPYCEFGGTVLHAAAESGDVRPAKALVKLGAFVNARATQGETPVFLAAQEGHLEMVKYLVDHGADLTLTRKTDQFTPVHIACLEGHEQVVDFLTKHDRKLMDARATCRGLTSVTPLHMAVHKGHESTVNILIKNGADIDAGDKENETPLHHICSLATIPTRSESPKTEVAESATQSKATADNGTQSTEKLYGNRDEINEKLGSLQRIDASFLQKYESILRILIQNGACLCPTNKKGTTPLAMARFLKNSIFVEILEKALSEAQPCSCCNKTALLKKCPDCSQARYCTEKCRVPHAAVCRKNSGASSSSSDHQKAQPEISSLIKSIKAQNHTLVNQLLASKLLDMNMSDEKGNTPLHVAAVLGNEKIVRIILAYTPLNPRYAADPSKMNKEGGTPMLIALGRKQFALAHLIAEKHCERLGDKEFPGMTPLHLAAQYGLTLFADYLIKNGAALNALMENGKTALECAVAEGHKVLVELLLSHKVDASLGVPIYTACLAGKEDLVRMLLKYDSSLAKKQMGSRETPLHFAVLKANNQGSVKALIESGADVNAVAQHGMTPLQSALAVTDSPHVVEALIEAGADLGVLTPQGITLLDVARGKNNPLIVKIVEEALKKAEPCTLCKKIVVAKKCAGCSQVAYCSKACQEKDWKAHKPLCQKESASSSSSTADLDKKMETHDRRGSDKTLLEVVSTGNALHVEEFLGREEVDANEADELGNTPLHHAVRGVYERIVDALLGYEPLNKAHEVDLTRKNQQGETALQMLLNNRIWAASQVRIAQALLEKGAPLEDDMLLTAAARGNKALVRLFVEQGADLFAQSIDGHTALEIARLSNHPRVVSYLEEALTGAHRCEKCQRMTIVSGECRYDPEWTPTHFIRYVY